VVRAFDLGKFQHLVDVGGATGHLVIAACQAWPHLQGTVFDLPEAVPLAREIVGASPVSERVSVQGGDFFKDALPSGDLYSLGRILHDWSDEKSLALLRRIHEALPENGAVLVAEKMLNPNRSGPDWALMQDLNMLVCTEGRERTLQEYQQLLETAGFRNLQGQVTDSPLDAVLAFK
jgi:acetylserotonin N-methyltransferase